MNKKIVIIGGGEIGQAVAKLLGPDNLPVIFDRDKNRQTTTSSLTDLLPVSSLVFLCIPARELPTVIKEVSRAIGPETMIISLSKGLSPDGRLPYEVIIEGLSPERVVVLAGPMLAEEIMDGKMAAAVVASADSGNYQKLRDVFVQSSFILTESADPKGANICGVVKNIYAIGLALAAALKLGDNSRGLLTAQAVMEMKILTEFLGGKEATVLSAAGMADLVATSGSVSSQNTAVGREIITSGVCSLESEGSLALPLLWSKVETKKDELPFLSAIADILLENRDPETVFVEFGYCR